MLSVFLSCKKLIPSGCNVHFNRNKLTIVFFSPGLKCNVSLGVDIFSLSESILNIDVTHPSYLLITLPLKIIQSQPPWLSWLYLLPKPLIPHPKITVSSYSEQADVMIIIIIIWDYYLSSVKKMFGSCLMLYLYRAYIIVQDLSAPSISNRDISKTDLHSNSPVILNTQKYLPFSYRMRRKLLRPKLWKLLVIRILNILSSYSRQSQAENRVRHNVSS